MYNVNKHLFLHYTKVEIEFLKYLTLDFLSMYFTFNLILFRMTFSSKVILKENSCIVTNIFFQLDSV